MYIFIYTCPLSLMLIILCYYYCNYTDTPKPKKSSKSAPSTSPSSASLSSKHDSHEEHLCLVRATLGSKSISTTVSYYMWMFDFILMLNISCFNTILIYLSLFNPFSNFPCSLTPPPHTHTFSLTDWLKRPGKIPNGLWKYH